MRCNAMLSGMLESTNTTLMPLVGARWSVRLISLCLVGGLFQASRLYDIGIAGAGAAILAWLRINGMRQESKVALRALNK